MILQPSFSFLLLAFYKNLKWRRWSLISFINVISIESDNASEAGERAETGVENVIVGL